ncbi:uroplakin-2, partial [Physeter macrocephalus]|uniref:Uroplakin-2 n=1 Tax=Physeter macrocephalus TaxID=9755 RepID=A0A455AYP5_PHYMC
METPSWALEKERIWASWLPHSLQLPGFLIDVLCYESPGTEQATTRFPTTDGAIREVVSLLHFLLPADFNISSLSGLLSPALTESLLVALPPCHLTGGNATLMVRRANDSKVVKSSFVVPPCRGRRELVSVVDSGSGFTVTRLSAYQMTNLVPGTKYYISYLVTKGASTESSREVPMS